MEQWAKTTMELERRLRGHEANDRPRFYRFAGELAALTASAALAASAPAACFSASTLTRCRMRFSSSRWALRQ